MSDGGGDVLAHDLVDVEHVEVDPAQLQHVGVAQRLTRPDVIKYDNSAIR